MTSSPNDVRSHVSPVTTRRDFFASIDIGGRGGRIPGE